MQARHRIGTLERLVTQAREMARVFEAERTKLPEFAKKDIGAQRLRLRMLLKDNQRGDHALLSMISQHLSGFGSLLEKFDAVFDLAGTEPMPTPSTCSMEFSPTSWRSPTRCASCSAPRRRSPPISPSSPRRSAARRRKRPGRKARRSRGSAALIAANLAPQCREVLTLRIQTTLASNVLLDTAQPNAESQLLADCTGAWTTAPAG